MSKSVETLDLDKLLENLAEISEAHFSNMERACDFSKRLQDSVERRAYLIKLARSFTVAEMKLEAEQYFWDGDWYDAIEELLDRVLPELPIEIASICEEIAKKYMRGV